MSSLFKHSFQGKQLKEFSELSLKSIPSLTQSTAKSSFKSIKNGSNASWNSYESAIDALQKNIKLNTQITEYKKTIDSKETSTLREIQSAKQYLIKLTTSTDTIQLLHEIEQGFSLAKGSLSPRVISNTHLMPLSHPFSRRSKSVIRNKDLLRLELSVTSDPNNHMRSSTTIIRSPNDTKKLRINTRILPQSNGQLQTETKRSKPRPRDKQRSKSVMVFDKVSPVLRAVPSMNTKAYLQFLLERAVTNKSFNDNDCDRLCKCAISMKCDWITVHSMWVAQCAKLLNKYTLKMNKEMERAHKKSKRRGSKLPLKMIKINENPINNTTKICVTIGYPLGQTSTVSKVAETKQSVNDGAKRIRLMVSAGKVIMEDWEYIVNEVRSVVSASGGSDVRIVFPDTSQITEAVKHMFNQKIMQGMAQKTPSPNGSTVSDGSKSVPVTYMGKPERRLSKLPMIFSDDETSEEGEEDDTVSLSAAKSLTLKRSEKKSDTDSSESSDPSNSDPSNSNSFSENMNPNALSPNDSDKISDLLKFGKNGRRKTMTSLRTKKKKSKSRSSSDSHSDNEDSVSVSIGQSVTEIDMSEPGAVSSHKRHKKRRKKKRRSKKLKKKERKRKRKERKRQRKHRIRDREREREREKENGQKKDLKRGNNGKKSKNIKRAKSMERIK